MKKDKKEDILDGVNVDISHEDAASLRHVADLLWEAEQGAPPLREDPVAAMLGLLPDPSYALDSKKLKQARKRAQLQLSDLVTRLNIRGWELDKSDLYRWENQSTNDVAPALIKALAEETGVSSDQLVTQGPKAVVPSAIAVATKSPLFAGLVDRWARLQNVSRGLASSELESRMLATVYRGDHADADQMLQSLEALLAASEGTEKTDRES